MKFLYHIPSLHTISAARTYLQGYKSAVEDMGHSFEVYTADDNLGELLKRYKTDIFLTSLNVYNLKYLNLDILQKYKKRGMKVFVNTPFWNSPMSKLRVNEATSLSENQEWIRLIKSGTFGDIYYNVCEQDDQRMAGFKKVTGYDHHTVLLAADKILASKKIKNTFDFSADISFIGTYLPERRAFMKECVFPLYNKYNLRLFCQDLTVLDRSLNFAMKVGQFFNIPYLKSFKKNNVTFDQERAILQNSTICLNIHEEYQKKYGDFNDRTFKIPLYGGFEITDTVRTISRYLVDGKEIVIARNKKDWFDKIDYYIKNPEKRLPIIEAGRKRVLKEHTYHNRVNQFITLYKTLL